MANKTTKTLYEVLGLSEDADMPSVKAAYRRAVHATHPDKFPDDPHATARFQTIQNTFEILRDAAKRADYDRNPYKVEVILDMPEPPRSHVGEQDNSPVRPYIYTSSGNKVFLEDPAQSSPGFDHHA